MQRWIQWWNATTFGDDSIRVDECAKKPCKKKSNYEFFYREFIDAMEKSEENNPYMKKYLKINLVNWRS